MLETGGRLRIAVGDFAGDADRVSTSCAPLASALHGGETLLLDDGRIALQVVESDGSEIVTRIEHGGVLGPRKGINAPGVEIPMSAVTAADAGEIEAAVSMGIDFVGVSFVQSGDDLRRAREMASGRGGTGIGLVAKIERPQALARFDDILTEADAIMVARGDLGLEIPLEHLPRVQKDLTRRARDAGVPVIVATQVLDTMRHEPRPTRAEVSDAANAVDDGVDAIMLAGETAVGAHPVLVAQTLDAILRDAESGRPDRIVPGDIADRHDRALCDAAVTLAARAGAAAIVAVTRSGATARLLAALRPPIPVHAVTADASVARRLTLCRGVSPLVVEPGALATAALTAELARRGVVNAGDAVVFRPRPLGPRTRRREFRGTAAVLNEVNLHFSPPDGRSTPYDRQDFVALACRAQRTVQVRLRAPSGSRLFPPPGLRLVLTALSRTSPRHVVRNAG